MQKGHLHYVRIKQASPRPTCDLLGVYRRFTEGFDTADLKDSKALLDEVR